MIGDNEPIPLPRQFVTPCPACGHCPTCGRGPSYPIYAPTPVPFWTGPTIIQCDTSANGEVKSFTPKAI